MHRMSRPTYTSKPLYVKTEQALEGETWMRRLFRKTLCIMTTLLVLLSLLRFHQASAAPPVKVDHDHQERYEIPRYDDPEELELPVWFNVSVDVWGYYLVVQPYYRINHSVAFSQGMGNETINDFTFWIENITYYGLDLNGEIVYKDTIRDDGIGYNQYNNSTSYEKDVYLAFTYINCTILDYHGPPDNPAYYNVNLTAWVSRRDIAISNVTASPSEVYPSENVSITVDVKNEGAVNETFNVTVYRNDTAIGTQTVSDLAPWNPITLTFNWNTTGAAHGNYEIRAEASIVPDERDISDNTYIDGTVLVRINNPPLDPSRPEGQDSGYAGWMYTYNTNTTDPNVGDQIWYLFDWGDDTNTTVGPYDSGVEAEASHFWQYPGTYNVTVKAKDYFDAWSDWSPPLVVTMTTQPGGGCPFIYAWNGTEYVIDNNLLPASARSNGTEVEDYYRLEQNLAPVYEGDYSYYSLLISEFQQEHSFFDQVQLYAVDHEASVNVAVSPTGEVLTYQNPSAPLSAVDDQGTSWLEELNDIDGNYYEGYNGSYLLLDFGDLNVSEGAKLVIRADPPQKYSIHVQVLDSAQNWNDVATVIPRALWSTDIVDLSSYLPDPNGELKVRLYFTDSHKVDFVGLDTTAQAQIYVEEASLLLAWHSEDGIVTTRLLSDDDIYAELIPEQQITLLFAANKQNGDQRTFIICVKGYYFTINN